MQKLAGIAKQGASSSKNKKLYTITETSLLG